MGIDNIMQNYQSNQYEYITLNTVEPIESIKPIKLIFANIGIDRYLNTGDRLDNALFKDLLNSNSDSPTILNLLKDKTHANKFTMENMKTFDDNNKKTQFETVNLCLKHPLRKISPELIPHRITITQTIIESIYKDIKDNFNDYDLMFLSEVCANNRYIFDDRSDRLVHEMQYGMSGANSLPKFIKTIIPQTKNVQMKLAMNDHDPVIVNDSLVVYHTTVININGINIVFCNFHYRKPCGSDKSTDANNIKHLTTVLNNIKNTITFFEDRGYKNIICGGDFNIFSKNGDVHDCIKTKNYPNVKSCFNKFDKLNIRRVYDQSNRSEQMAIWYMSDDFDIQYDHTIALNKLYYNTSEHMIIPLILSPKVLLKGGSGLYKMNKMNYNLIKNNQFNNH